MNPTQFLTRLFRGDAFAVREERGDVLEPSRFVAEVDAGWRHYVSSRRADPDQALVSASVRYGDPFDRAVSRPFDSFDLDVEISPGEAHCCNTAAERRDDRDRARS